MKITYTGSVTADDDGRYFCPIRIGGGVKARTYLVGLMNSFDADGKEPADVTGLLCHPRFEPSRAVPTYQDLKPGDYVVHRYHGIGMYDGIHVPKQNMVLKYRYDVRVWVPLERIDLVQKYFSATGTKPQLDRLDGKEWTALRKSSIWVFRRKFFKVEGAELVPKDEIILRIKQAAFRQEKELNQIQKEVAAFENFERLPSARRERIPESVRLFVWQRDGGHCVKCGSNERLEFDHVIPVIEGGSSTERNVQLLCEKCNRAKGKTV